MRIFELFDKTANWQWVDSSKNLAKFHINDNVYEVEFYSRGNDEYWTSFSLGQGGDRKTSLTGTGNQYTVLATVYDIIKSGIKHHNPSRIEFTSEGDSRTSVYQKLFSRLPGWDLTMNPGLRSTHFVLTKQ